MKTRLRFWFALCGIFSFVTLMLAGHGWALEQKPDLKVDQKTNTLDQKSDALWVHPDPERPLSAPNGTLYLWVTYQDEGYGKLTARLQFNHNGTLQSIGPDRCLGIYRNDTRQKVTARMRFRGVASTEALAVRLGREKPQDAPLTVVSATLQDQPPDSAAAPAFAYVLSDPWLGPYREPGRDSKCDPIISPPDNTTLKGKVMAGYQGWYRTPNDPDDRGWGHWGDLAHKTFAVDMWPDVSPYPPHCLEKAADVKLKSGKPAYVFSSAWPETVAIHFRWMREHDIDGVFLQRFVSDRFCCFNGRPEWVLAAVRAAANREGRLWALEYDVSGYPDAQLLETLKRDWRWMVDTFRLLDDPTYAREGGKPVVAIWGMPVPNRHISPETANAVVDFFKNDPRYGGNYVIGGIQGDWRRADAHWQAHFKKYDGLLPWMSRSYQEDFSDFAKMGIDSYAHVWPGFSWANLKHLPGADLSTAYSARDGGQFYWNLLSKAAWAGVDRLFIGMLDEYDEATAILPMSDDAPPTPEKPGFVTATFCNGIGWQEAGEFVLLPGLNLPLGEQPPVKIAGKEHFFVRMGGNITFPKAGNYKLSVEGAAGDDAELWLDGKRILSAKLVPMPTGTAYPITETMSEAMVQNQEMLPIAVTPASEPITITDPNTVHTFRLDYRHGSGKGTLRLLWNHLAEQNTAAEPVPATALSAAWGRFLTNEGYPADWWLQLTRMGKEMMLGKRPANAPQPKPD